MTAAEHAEPAPFDELDEPATPSRRDWARAAKAGREALARVEVLEDHHRALVDELAAARARETTMGRKLATLHAESVIATWPEPARTLGRERLAAAAIDDGQTFISNLTERFRNAGVKTS